MSALLASSVAPQLWRPTTAQLVIRSRTEAPSDVAALLGMSLHHFTDLIIDQIDADQIDVEIVELHRITTILTKQLQQTCWTGDQFVPLRWLVTDPRRVASPDGRSAAELCGSRWEELRLLADDRACAAIEGARRFGEATVIQLATLRAAECEIPWWGSRDWERRVDAWSKTCGLGPMSKRAVRRTPELVADDVLAEIIHG